MKNNFAIRTDFKTMFMCLMAVQFLAGCQQAGNNNSDITTTTPKEKTEPKELARQNTGGDGLQVFIDELSDHRLIKLSNYNSGSNGDGMQSESWIDLCGNGRFFAHESSSISINGNTSQDNKDDEGTWEVVGSADAPLLKITARDGQSGTITIRLEETKLYLNGERMYHMPKGDPNGPQSCN